MFSRIFQAGQTEPEIELATRDGEHVPNGVSSSPPIHGRFLEWKDDKKKHPDWIERKPPCGVYNCFGLVFASRRTCVYDPPLVDKSWRRTDLKRFPALKRVLEIWWCTEAPTVKPYTLAESWEFPQQREARKEN
jgi:hypothetical protein